MVLLPKVGPAVQIRSYLKWILPKETLDLTNCRVCMHCQLLIQLCLWDALHSSFYYYSKESQGNEWKWKCRWEENVCRPANTVSPWKHGSIEESETWFDTWIAFWQNWFYSFESEEFRYFCGMMLTGFGCIQKSLDWHAWRLKLLLQVQRPLPSSLSKTGWN